MERKTFFPKKNTGGGNRSETFAITVQAYDVKASPPVVVGTRLDNGEEVTVFLRQDVEYKRGNFARSEIKDFAAPRKDRQHPGTAAGGTLLIQEAFKQPNGSWGARWIQSLSHTAGEAEVFMTTIHVSPVKRAGNQPNGKQYSSMTVLHDGNFDYLTDEMYKALEITPPFPVQNVDELRHGLMHVLQLGMGAGVRVSNADGFDAMYVSKKRDLTEEQAVDNFMREVADLAPQIDSGAVKCEVIPYSNIFAGPKTVSVMDKNPVMQNRLSRFNTEREGNAGKTYKVAVYRPAIVAVRFTDADEHGNRSAFFSHFEPVNTRQPVHGLVAAICYAQTELLDPEPPKPEPVESAAKENHAPAGGPPNQGADSSMGSFEGPGSQVDEDLMGAAQGHGQADDYLDDIPQEQPQPEAAPVQAESQPRAPTPRRYAGRRMAA